MELMVPDRGDITELPNLDAFTESHSVGADPQFGAGDVDMVIGEMREAGWDLGFYQTYTNAEAQGGGSVLRISFAVDAFETADAARRVLPVMHGATLKHLDYWPELEGTAEEFPVQGLGEGAGPLRLSKGSRTATMLSGARSARSCRTARCLAKSPSLKLPASCTSASVGKGRQVDREAPVCRPWTSPS
jgi:hypothetical protein